MNETEELSPLFENPINFADYFLKFNAFDYQKEFLKLCDGANRIVAVWARQTGKSTCLSIFALWYGIFYEKRNILILSPTQEQSNLLFRKIVSHAKYNPIIFSFISRITSTEIEFYNGSMIKSLPVGDSGDTIRGWTADVIILEESGYIKDEIVNSVIMPMGAAKPHLKVIQIGTPFTKNHFYEAFTNGFYKISHYDYKVSPLITEAYIEERRTSMTNMEFEMEFMANFTSDSDCYFSQVLINNCIDDIQEKSYADLDKVYYLGVDLARMGQDSSVFITIEYSDGIAKVVNIEETQHKKLTDAIGRIAELHKKFKYAKIFIDETGLGAGPADVLTSMALPMSPVIFTIRAKQDIYSNLKTIMEHNKLKIPNNRKLIIQLADVRYEFTGLNQMKLHHSERGFDDYCDALALSVAEIVIRAPLIFFDFKENNLNIKSK